MFIWSRVRKTWVRPHLEYGVHLFHYENEALESLWKCFIRMLPGLAIKNDWTTLDSFFPWSIGWGKRFIKLWEAESKNLFPKLEMSNTRRHSFEVRSWKIKRGAGELLLILFSHTWRMVGGSRENGVWEAFWQALNMQGMEKYWPSTGRRV